MKTPMIATFVLLALMLTPTALAGTIQVTNTQQATCRNVYAQCPKLSDDPTSFLLGGVAFSSGVGAVTIETFADFGKQYVGDSANMVIAIEVSDANDTVNVELHRRNYYHLAFGSTGGHASLRIYLNGTSLLYSDVKSGDLWAPGNVNQYIAYRENIDALDCRTVTESAGGYDACVPIQNATGLFYVPSRVNPGGDPGVGLPGYNKHYGDPFQAGDTAGDQASTFLTVDGDIAPWLFLADMDRPENWTITPSWDQTPDDFGYTYEFDTNTTYESKIATEEDASCGGAMRRVFYDIFQVCPSIGAVASAIVSFIPNLLGDMFGLFSPDAANVFYGVGTFVGDIAEVSVLFLDLLLINPFQTFTLLLATGSGLGFLVGGLSGDLHMLLVYQKQSMVLIYKVTFAYFRVLAYLLQWIGNLVVQGIQAIGSLTPFT